MKTKPIQITLVVAIFSAIFAALGATFHPALSLLWAGYALIGGFVGYVAQDLPGAWRSLSSIVRAIGQDAYRLRRNAKRFGAVWLRQILGATRPNVGMLISSTAGLFLLLAYSVRTTDLGIAAASFCVTVAALLFLLSAFASLEKTAMLSDFLGGNGSPTCLAAWKLTRGEHVEKWRHSRSVSESSYLLRQIRLLDRSALLQLGYGEIMGHVLLAWKVVGIGLLKISLGVAALAGIIGGCLSFPKAALALAGAAAVFAIIGLAWRFGRSFLRLAGRALVRACVTLHTEARLTASAGVFLGTLSGLFMSLALGVIGSPLAVALVGGACGGVVGFALAALSGFVVRRAVPVSATA